MAYNNLSQPRLSSAAAMSVFVVDGAEDVAGLPTTTAGSADGRWGPCQMGSIASTVDGGTLYMLGGDGKWVVRNA